MKIYAFGDIHGEVFKLKTLIERVIPEKDSKLIFLGDYIDRGKHTFEVIEYLIELNKKYDCVFLMGNHEAMFMDYLTGIYEDIFIYNGGKNTIKSYYKNGYNIKRTIDYIDRRMPPTHISFLRSLKNYYETEDYIFVHAGIKPGISLENTPQDILVWDRNFHDRCNKYDGEKIVVFGHTPSTNVMNEPKRICIDTGACFNDKFLGHLTCVKLPDRIFTKQGSTLEDINGEGE